MRACNALLKLFLLWIVGQTITGCNGPDQIAGVEGSGAPVAFTGGVVGNGQITARGSIYVGGVEYSLDHASIQIDGQPGSASQLIVGQIVTVNGKFGDGPTIAQASSVNYEPDLIGPISAIDSAHRQITVLGQQVSFDDQAPTIIDTSITPASFEGLIKGLQVEISGFTNAQGVLSARRITAQGAGSAYAVDGVVEKIDQPAKTFSVRALGIDFASADLSGIAVGTLKNGDTVRVEGRKFSAAGTLIASKISLHSLALPGTAGDTAIVEGWITRYVSDADFDVNGHHIVGPSHPIIPSTNGDPSQLRLDQFVTVFGQLRSDGGVDAREINVIKDIWANITLDACTLADGCSKATQLMIDGVPVTTESFQPGDLATSYNYFWPDYSKSTLFKNLTFPGAQTFERKLIVVEHTLRGPLEALDLDTGTLRIMGQSVVTGVLDTDINGKPGGSVNSYWRDQKSLRSFTVGQMLEVSGHETATGEIVATGINSGAGKDYRVIGLATALDTSASRFTMQGLTVDYTGAFIDGFSGGVFHDGDRVLVTGDSYAAGILTAKRVSYLGRQVRGAVGAVLTLNGVITRYVSPDDFDVAGVPVHLVQGATKIEGCGTPRVNAFISIYGALQSDGRIWSGIRPQLWCFRTGISQLSALQLSAQIDGIDLQRKLIHVLGLTLPIFDQSVIDSAESYGGDTRINNASVPLSDLHVGDWILARGLLGSSNTNWTRVHITKNLGGPTLRLGPTITGGVISAIAPDMVVGGVTVHTDAQTQFWDSCGTPRSAIEAFDYLTKSLQSAGPASTPPIVSLDGNWAAPAVTAVLIHYGDTACPTP